MTDFKITPAMLRALAAVNLGKVERVYNASGNILRGPKGVGSSVLWKIEKLGMIKEGQSSGGASRTYCQMALTDAGRNALFAAGR